MGIMVLLFIFVIFLSLLHWKRVQAEAERNARMGSFDEVYGDDDYHEMGDEIDLIDDEEQYYQNDTTIEQEAGNQLGVPTKPYDRVISDLTNEMPDERAQSKKKKKKKKRKKVPVHDEED